MRVSASLHKIRIDLGAAVLRQMGLKVIAYLCVAFHAQIGFGVTALPTTLFNGRALEGNDAKARFSSAHRCRETCHATTDHNQIVFKLLTHFWSNRVINDQAGNCRGSPWENAIL